MDDDAAVSCYICLRADEYGAMLKVRVGPGGSESRPPVIICRSCVAAIADECGRVDEGQDLPDAKPLEVPELREPESTVVDRMREVRSEASLELMDPDSPGSSDKVDRE